MPRSNTWSKLTTTGIGSKSCSNSATVRWGWIITKSAVGSVGIITSHGRCWRSGSWCWNDSASEKKTPAITAPQVRDLFSRLLQHPAPTAQTIANTITTVLQRNEETRIDHWHTATQTFPPRRTPAHTTNSN